MLNFEEFLFVLRGRPNEERQSIIDYVYSIFDKDHTGVADANEMRKVFNCQKHPKFKMGKLTESQMFYLYLKNFNNQVKMTVTKKVINKYIIINISFFFLNIQEWDDYYAGLSLAIDNDAHFCSLLKNQFKLE